MFESGCDTSFELVVFWVGFSSCFLMIISAGFVYYGNKGPDKPTLIDAWLEGFRPIYTSSGLTPLAKKVRPIFLLSLALVLISLAIGKYFGFCSIET